MGEVEMGLGMRKAGERIEETTWLADPILFCLPVSRIFSSSIFSL